MEAYDVFLVGNPGAGKIFLFYSLGGDSKSGFLTLDGLTTPIKTQLIQINGDVVRLIDAPSLLDFDNGGVSHNAKWVDHQSVG